MSYPFIINYGMAFTDQYIQGRTTSKWYMSTMGLNEMAFGRVVTLDAVTGWPYMGFVYWTPNTQYTYVLRLNLNLDYILAT